MAVVARDRKRGELRTIGSSAVAEYLGVRRSGIWSVIAVQSHGQRVGGDDEILTKDGLLRDEVNGSA